MGNWTVTVTPMSPMDCNGQTDRFRVVAVRRDRQAVITLEKLTSEQVENFSPDQAWASGLNANHKHARALNERKDS